MLAEERREKIMHMLEAEKSVEVNDLAEHFELSKGSIRRDLNILEDRGMIIKTYGGAMLPGGTTHEPPFNLQKKEYVEEKKKIGKKAVSLISPGETIFIDSGTTALEVAKFLDKNTTVLTNNLKVVSWLEKAKDIEVIVTGGCYRKKTVSLLGPIAEKIIKETRVNKGFIGATAIDIEKGMFTGSLEEGQFKKLAIENSIEVIVVSDSSKFDKQAFSFIAPNSSIDILITDENLADNHYQKLKDEGVEVIKC